MQQVIRINATDRPMISSRTAGDFCWKAFFPVQFDSIFHAKRREGRFCFCVLIHVLIGGIRDGVCEEGYDYPSRR